MAGQGPLAFPRNGKPAGNGRSDWQGRNMRHASVNLIGGAEVGAATIMVLQESRKRTWS